MAPHLAGAELDVEAHSVAQGTDANAILKVVVAARKRSKTAPPKVWAIRRAMQGTTHKRGVGETRGRKKKLNQVQVNRLFTKRAPPVLCTISFRMLLPSTF